MLYSRLVGTQFPPWAEGTDVWGVQHLMHPELKEPVFAEWYGSSQLQEVVCQLLGTKPGELQLGKGNNFSFLLLLLVIQLIIIL